MGDTTRRTFLLSSAVAGAAVVLDRAPAYAQKRELTLLSTNHFVPASDEELRRQAEAFGKQAGLTVKVDTIHGLQLPAKRAADKEMSMANTDMSKGNMRGGCMHYMKAQQSASAK